MSHSNKKHLGKSSQNSPTGLPVLIFWSVIPYYCADSILFIHTCIVLVRYSIYRSIAILVNVRYRYLMVSRYFDISNDQTILGRYIVRSGESSHSILKQPSIWKHCPKTSISRYLLLIVRLSIHQSSILVPSVAKRFLVILKYRRTKSIVHLPSNS